MKTNDLVRVLSTNLEVVDSGRVKRELAGAVVAGILAVLGLVIVTRGVRADVHDLHALAYLLLKLGLAAAIVIWGLIYLIRLARPGGEANATVIRARWPLVAVAVLAGASLLAAPLWHWHTMTTGDGDGWLECLISIPLIAIVPFVGVIWILRRMAPTNLQLTGAVAGFVAGGISAMGYALHCTGDSVTFIALWYGGTIALCTIAGAMLGPRLLRW